MCYLQVAKTPHRPVFQTTRNQHNIDRTQLYADVATYLYRQPFARYSPSATTEELDFELRSAPDAHDPETGQQLTPLLASPDAALWLCGSGLTVYKLIIHSVQREMTKVVSEANTHPQVAGNYSA